MQKHALHYFEGLSFSATTVQPGPQRGAVLVQPEISNGNWELNDI
jgi:hypothetical protein